MVTMQVILESKIDLSVWCAVSFGNLVLGAWQKSEQKGGGRDMMSVTYIHHIQTNISMSMLIVL